MILYSNLGSKSLKFVAIFISAVILTTSGPLIFTDSFSLDPFLENNAFGHAQTHPKTGIRPNSSLNYLYNAHVI